MSHSLLRHGLLLQAKLLVETGSGRQSDFSCGNRQHESWEVYGNDFIPNGLHHQLDGGMNPEFEHDVAAMTLGGLHGHAQQRRDFT